MNAVKIALLVVGLFVVLPVLSYLILKFATAGYLRAKDRHQIKHQQERKKRYAIEERES